MTISDIFLFLLHLVYSSILPNKLMLAESDFLSKLLFLNYDILSFPKCLRYNRHKNHDLFQIVIHKHNSICSYSNQQFNYLTG